MPHGAGEELQGAEMKIPIGKLQQTSYILFILIVLVVVGIIGWSFVPPTVKCHLRVHTNDYQKDLCLFSARMKDFGG